MNKPEKGFSLVELLVVIAITGILVSMATAAYTTAQKKARDSKRKSQLTAVQQALEQYYQGNSASYPVPCSTIGTTYLPDGVPEDPKTNRKYDATYGAYCTAATYCLCGALEGETNTLTDCAGAGAPSGYNGFFCVKNLQ